MHFSLDDRTCVLSVGEFAGFTLGPRDAGGGGPSGIWRAQLGQQWHARLHAAVEAEAAAQAGTRALVEVPLTLGCVEQGWNLTFAGRVDQIIIPAGGAAVVREIKTVAGPLPAEEATLRAEHADYFVQLATYVVLLRATPGAARGNRNQGHEKDEGDGRERGRFHVPDATAPPARGQALRGGSVWPWRSRRGQEP